MVVAVVRVETVALGFRYFLLVSSTPPTTSPVSFNLMSQNFPKILLSRPFDNLYSGGVFDSVHLPSSKLFENITFIPLGIAVIAVIVVVLVLLVVLIVIVEVLVAAVVLTHSLLVS